MKKKIPKSARIEPENKWAQIGDPLAYQLIAGNQCTIALHRLPYGSSRGNYVARLWPVGAFALSVEPTELLPKYYFDETRAKLEIEAWLEKRGQQI